MYGARTKLEYKIDIKGRLDAATDSGSGKPRIYGTRTELGNKMEIGKPRARSWKAVIQGFMVTGLDWILDWIWGVRARLPQTFTIKRPGFGSKGSSCN